MNKYFMLIVVFLFLLIQSGWTQDLKGNGRITQEEHYLPEFTGIVNHTNFNIQIIPGPISNVVVETDENLQESLDIQVVDSKVVIKRVDEKANLNYSKAMIYVRIHKLNHLASKGVGNMKTKSKVKTKEILISSGGIGNMKIDLYCDKVMIEQNGTGNIRLKGKAKEMELFASGAGNLQAKPFVCQDVKLHSTGVGNMAVTVNKNIAINLNGAGNVEFYGKAKMGKIKVKGTGVIQQMD